MTNLIKIQKELKCPKGNFNSFGKYKYRSAEDILEAVKPLLHKYECTLTISDELCEPSMGCVALKSIATFTDGKNSISVCGFAGIDTTIKGMSVPQTYGTASSYARKYALNGLFLIDETEADQDSNKPEKKEEAYDNEAAIKNAYAAGKITKEQAIELQKNLKK